MCSLVRVVYFSLFVIVVCSDMKDEPRNDKKSHISKVHRSKTTIKNSDISTKTSNNTNNVHLKTGTEAVAKHNEHERKEFTNNDNVDQMEDVTHADISEEDIQRTGEVTKSSTNIISSTEVSSSLPDDFKAEEVSKSGNDYSDDEFYDEEPNSAYEEILMHTPIRNTANYHTVLDLKGRRGHEQSQEEETKTELEDLEDNTSKIGQFPKSNINMRSGYVPPDYDDDVSKPSNIKLKDVNHFKRPNPANSNMPSPFYRPNNGSPVISNLPSMPISRYLPPFFNKMNSRESIYYDPSSRENGQGTSPVLLSNTLRSPFFGFAHPNNQIYNAKMTQRCPACFPERGFSQERTFRRSVETNTYRTANGRSLEFDPQGENAYPYIPSEDVFPNQNAIQELFKPEARQAIPQLDPPNHDFQRLGLESDPEKKPFSNVLMPFQQYLSRSNPILLNRRIGLGGLPQFVHY